jgi:hypothetical protein
MSSRKEYFESFDGRKYQYWNRFAQNSMIITYEISKFQTKRSKSETENLRFQNYILSKLISDNKRCYRGNVAVEFIFKVNQNNSPAIQSLLKHYIDLIQEPLETINTKRKYLLIKDDSQIKALSAHYWKESSSEKQEIIITILPIRDFVYNLEFAGDLQFGKFNDRRKKTFLKNYGYEDEGDHLSNWDNREIEQFKGVKIEIDGEEIEFNEFNKRIHDEEKNQVFLKSQSNLFASSVLALITEPENEKRENSLLNISLNKIGRASALNGWYNMDLGSVPVSEGESKLFKENIKNVIKDWKNSKGKLLPNNPAISLKFFYEKPDHVTHDLDNLLRYVLPHFHELINKDRYFKEVPSVEIYQIQTISKNMESGNLYLRIEDFGKNNMFRITQRLLDEYE